MSVDRAFLDHIQDVLAGVGPLRIKRMFGAAGIYGGELFFAVAEDDVLYLKADAETEPLFAGAGSAPFTFESGGETKVTHFWTMPEAALDDPEEAVHWARLALDVAARAAAKKRRKPSRPAP